MHRHCNATTNLAVLRTFAVCTAVHVLGLPLEAQAIGFADTTLAPANYRIQTFVQGGSIAISASNNGNPGSALIELFTVPGPSFDTDHSYAYAINKNFTYDPATQGAVGSISFSIDKSVSFDPSNVNWGNGQGALVEQGGRLYQTDTALPAIQGVFQTASWTVSSPLSFYRIVDLASHQVDQSSHPDFAGGPMQMGFYNGAGVPPGAPNLQIRYVFDNFSVSVSNVPEPSGVALWAAGLAVGATRIRKAARKTA